MNGITTIKSSKRYNCVKEDNVHKEMKKLRMENAGEILPSNT